ncbi:MAG: 30S ribosomal protein S4 [Bacteroidetes bacterium]|nr:30S ribosomal protein S4 [Bacteroidota bacterium]
MARYTDAVCKLCRREKQKLFLKGARCFTAKCAIEKRNYAPGQHGQSRRSKFSEYARQLREKQKLKRIYGLLEQPFRLIYEKSNRQKGITGENLIVNLERRLDNVVYRLGLAPSRNAARQLVRHRHLLVNDQLVDIPAFSVKPGDVVKVKEQSKKMASIHDSVSKIKDSQLPAWLEIDKANLTGKFLSLPTRAEVQIEVNEQLIVELYSK